MRPQAPPGEGVHWQAWQGGAVCQVPPCPTPRRWPCSLRCRCCRCVLFRLQCASAGDKGHGAQRPAPRLGHGLACSAALHSRRKTFVKLALRIDRDAWRVEVVLGAGRGASAVWLPPGFTPEVAAASELLPSESAGQSFQVQGGAQLQGGGGPRGDAAGDGAMLRLFVFAKSGRLLRFHATTLQPV